MSKKDLISVVVPVYSEEQNLPIFYEEICKAIEESDFDVELIFVNDGSVDKSLSILQALHNKDARVKIINFSRNFGSYAAIEAGFTYAKGDAVMAISADLQDPPSLITQFVEEWRKGNEIVWGVRAEREDPFFKALFAKLFYWGIRKLVFKDFPTDGMDIGLFDRDIIKQYLRCQDRNSIPFFTIYSMGYKQARVPYKRAKRLAGESGWPFWKRIKCAIDIVVGFSYFPLRMITFIGLLCAGFGLFYGLVLICLKIFAGIGTSGWTSLAVFILFIGGLQMFSIGIIAEYIWRISDRVKNKPVYFVMDEFGFSELQE
ncbi:MAG: glycosyltransferase family 2 protein [Gammaproteobacteria bacterium]|jgi:dolichol-phosphate mannosyltransferase